ncbi:MAG: DEAD/DEAH box helicase, partial [Planctomycetia bacterium]
KIFRILAKLRLQCSLPTGLETSPKITEALNRIQSLAPDRKVVIFSEWRKVLRSLQKELKHFQIDHVFLHGQMTGDQRDSVVRDFRENPNCRVFLSTDAGSSGLNLQVADTLFNLDIPWNPAVLKQRISRIHRLGQKKPVQIFNLLMKDSIEEKVLHSQNKKLDLFSKLFGSAHRTEGLQKNIESDILELVSDWTKTNQEASNKAHPSHPLWSILVPFLKSIEQQLTDHKESDIPIALKPALKVLCESILNQLKNGGSLK